VENRKKILIVDDDSTVVELLKINLESQGFDVIFSTSGKKVMNMVRDNHPDLVVLDVLMPDGNGFEICREIKQDKDKRFTPVIILSVKHKVIDKIEGLKLGADEYITKPFDVDEFVTRVKNLLKKTEQFLEANPLTRLGGSASIMYEANERLKNNSKFAFCYIDINNFKAFNDTYGFDKGDNVIKETAGIIMESMGDTDFLGHIGGDDFVLISGNEKIKEVCRKTVKLFDKRVKRYYSQEDIERGYIISKDRQGRINKFPLMTLSIGVVTNEGSDINHYGKIVEVATQMKKYVKEQEDTGRSFFAVNRRKIEEEE